MFKSLKKWMNRKRVHRQFGEFIPADKLDQILDGKEPAPSTDEKVQHREWIELTRAKDGMEAMMIQSYLDSHDIENQQPYGRHQQMEGGISLDGSSSYGIRIDVPSDQHDKAKLLLKEKRKP